MLGRGTLDRRLAEHLARTPRLAYVVALVVPAVLITAVLATGVQPWIVLRDPIAAMGGSADQRYYGMLSNVGILVWASTGAICLFVAVTDRARLSAHGRHFLLFAGALTWILAIDDLFMLHEQVSSPLAYLPYAIAAVVYLRRFSHLVLSLDTVLIGAAVVLMAMSIAVDLLIELRVAWHLPGPAGSADRPGDRSAPPASLGIGFMEDVLKLLGICCWAVFHIRAAHLLRDVPDHAADRLR